MILYAFDPGKLAQYAIKFTPADSRMPAVMIKPRVGTVTAVGNQDCLIDNLKKKEIPCLPALALISEGHRRQTGYFFFNT